MGMAGYGLPFFSILKPEIAQMEKISGISKCETLIGVLDQCK